jgi:DNA replication and repair protein RecF
MTKQYLRLPMFLRHLSAVNFKNYTEAELDFSPTANAFTGNNGEGKTNLLDAVHYLSLCKSYFNPFDNQNIKHGTELFVLTGIYDVNGTEEHIACGLKRNQKKVFKRNKKEYERLADHIGFLPAVMISPVDSRLITEGSEERRKFIDSIISQFDKLYLDDLINYNKIIAQRNALLKQFSQRKKVDSASLEIWNEQMVPLAEKIYAVRLDFINRFVPIFKKHYQFISDAKEEVMINYESDLHTGNFAERLAHALDKDLALQYSSVGIHKDELEFHLSGFPLKRFASQGQQKSFLIALKLAQFDFMKEILGVKPIILLDDIFDKLDDKRVQRLMELVSHENFGQIFITDTHPERVAGIFDRINVPIKLFKVDNGTVDELRK